MKFHVILATTSRSMGVSQEFQNFLLREKVRCMHCSNLCAQRQRKQRQRVQSPWQNPPHSSEQQSYAKALLQKSLETEHSIYGKVAVKLRFTKEDRCKSESKIRQSLAPCQLKLGRHWSKLCSQIPEPQNHRTCRAKQANHRNRYSTSAFEQPGPKRIKCSPAEPDRWSHQKTPWHGKHNQHKQKLG